MTIAASALPWAADKMGRKGVAKFLTKHLDSDPSIKVLNINASWGTGKTFFLNNWMLEQANERVCVYFNAWEADFSGDPFVALASAIREQLKSTIGPGLHAEEAIAKFTKKAAKTLIAATPALTKGIVKKFTGIDISLISEVIESDDIADAAEKAVENLIESNKESLDTVRDFKDHFHKLVNLAINAIATGADIKPAYIFIDELDRCRPTFAIELLERVKHLFDIPDCKFIIATDTIQLGHSIRAVYGSGFASDKYLKRFFDREFTLSVGELDEWIKANVSLPNSRHIAVLGCQTHYGAIDRFRSDPTQAAPNANTIFSGKLGLDETQIITLALAMTFRTKPRELERIMAQILSINSNVEGKEFNYFWAAYLTFLKDEAPDIYETAIRGEFSNILVTLNTNYPPKNLNFLQINATLHEIFMFYLTRFRAGLNGAKDLARQNASSDIDYIIRGNQAFFNDFDLLAKYPALVELAHSIE
jgi:hypothetical protein